MAHLFDNVQHEKQTACGPISEPNFNVHDRMPMLRPDSSSPGVIVQMPVLKPEKNMPKVTDHLPVLTIRKDGSIDCHKR